MYYLIINIKLMLMSHPYLQLNDLVLWTPAEIDDSSYNEWYRVRTVEPAGRLSREIAKARYVLRPYTLHHCSSYLKSAMC